MVDPFEPALIATPCSHGQKCRQPDEEGEVRGFGHSDDTAGRETCATATGNSDCVEGHGCPASLATEILDDKLPNFVGLKHVCNRATNFGN